MNIKLLLEAVESYKWVGEELLVFIQSYNVSDFFDCIQEFQKDDGARAVVKSDCIVVYMQDILNYYGIYSETIFPKTKGQE